MARRGEDPSVSSKAWSWGLGPLNAGLVGYEQIGAKTAQSMGDKPPRGARIENPHARIGFGLS